MHTPLKPLVIALALPIALAACVSNPQSGGAQAREYRADTYAAAGALRIGQAVEMEVVGVRDIKIKPGAGSAWATPAYSAAGGTLGALAGSQVGGGSGKKAATVIGGLTGAAAGAALADPGLVPAQEIILREPTTKRLQVVVQANSDLKAGERVLAVTVGNEVRLSRWPVLEQGGFRE